MSTVHVVVPDGIDDPARPSGGNAYDRRVCRALGVLGWVVRQHPVAGDWPRPDGSSLARLATTLARVPDGAVVLLDGLVASAAAEVLVPAARRLPLVVLVHLPLGVRPPALDGPPAADDAGRPAPDSMGMGMGLERAGESAALHAAAAIVTTSRWTRDWLLTTYRLPPHRVHVVPPGVEPADLVPGSAAGGRLLCVGAVTAIKGQDVLVEALAELAGLDWSCRCVGSLDIDPVFADRVRRRAAAAGLDGRLRFTGPRVGADVEAAYAAADLLLVPSRLESYGMVVTEALARGIPVIGADVGGLSEALGRVPAGAPGGARREAPGQARPGLLVPAGDPASLAVAVRAWLTDAGLRADLRGAARRRRAALSDWSVTADRLAGVLREVPAPLEATPPRPQHTRLPSAQPDCRRVERAISGCVADGGRARRWHDAAGGGSEVRGITESTVRVSPQWLALREPADAAARSRRLASALAGGPGAGVPKVIHDLGCGTGSMGRWLAPLVEGPQHWVVHDRDADLLAIAARDLPRSAADGAAVTVEPRHDDLTRLRPEQLAGASLVTASALLDMLTADELRRLVACLCDAGCPSLLTLSVIGRVELTPAHPLDHVIAAAFNDHQRRTVAGRTLLGPDAAGRAVRLFRSQGARVTTAPSPWRLDASKRALAGEWLDGWVGAACEQRPELAVAASDYLAGRRGELEHGRLGVIVHHLDVLARPPAADW